MKLRKSEVNIGFDATSLVVDTMLGVPALAGSKLLYQLGSYVGNQFILKENLSPSGIDFKTLEMLSIQLLEEFSGKFHPHELESGRKLSNKQIELIGISGRDAKNRIADIDLITDDLIKTDSSDNKRITELNNTLPELEDWSVSCPTCFPCIYSTLLGMKKESRFNADFSILSPKLFGTQQIARDLSNISSLPDIMITANSPFFMLGPDYHTFNRYKLFKEIYRYNQVLMKKPFLKRLTSRKNSIAYYENSVAEQYVKSKAFDLEVVPYCDFSEFYENPASIDNNFVVAWQPMIKLLQERRWKIVPGSDFSTPISIFVKTTLIKDKKSKLIIEWFIKAFLLEFDYQSKNIDHALRCLLLDVDFIGCYKRHLEGYDA